VSGSDTSCEQAVKVGRFPCTPVARHQLTERFETGWPSSRSTARCTYHAARWSRQSRRPRAGTQSRRLAFRRAGRPFHRESSWHVESLSALAGALAGRPAPSGPPGRHPGFRRCTRLRIFSGANAANRTTALTRSAGLCLAGRSCDPPTIRQRSRPGAAEACAGSRPAACCSLPRTPTARSRRYSGLVVVSGSDAAHAASARG
jgi:hypothetical protein